MRPLGMKIRTSWNLRDPPRPLRFKLFSLGNWTQAAVSTTLGSAGP